MSVIRCSSGESSDFISLARGDHVLCFRWTGTPGRAVLLERPNNFTCWAPYQPTFGTTLEITGDVSIKVWGARHYAVDVQEPGELTVTWEKC